MNIFEVFDKQVSQDAKTFPLSEDASIDLLPMGSDLARRRFEQLMEPYQARIKAGGELTEEEAKKVNTRFFAEVIITGWKGIREAPTDEEKAAKKPGKEIKFSAENAFKLLEALPRFNALIARMAADESAFEIAKVEDEEKNS